MKKLVYVWLLAILLSSNAGFAAERGKPLSLSAAIEKALAGSPRLKASNEARLASQGERTQAGMLPNPALSVEAENFAGRGAYRGVDSAETTVGVSQLIELGGKRAARQAMADGGVALSTQELEGARLDTIRDVTIAYADAVATAEQLKLAQAQKKLAAEVLESVTKRVNAAAEPLIQKSKAQVAYSIAEIALDKAERNHELARQKLAMQWGDNKTDFILDHTAFEIVAVPEPLETLTKNLENNPDYRRWNSEIERRKAALDFEKAVAVPDPSLNVGLRDFRDTGDQAFVMGISLPLPVLNRNQGSIQRAGHEVSKVESERETARLNLRNELNQTWQTLENAYRQTKSLKEKVIPSAEKAFSLSRQGYNAGKFPYLEVLDAQRTLFEARVQYYQALQTCHIQRAELHRLTAKHTASYKEVRYEK